MTVKNLDKEPQVIENKEEQAKALQVVFENGDAAAVANAIVENYENNFATFQKMMNDTIAEAKRANEQQWDATALASRGVRTLTTEEKKFYNAAIESQGFDDTASFVPPTVFERVFEDLALDHTLLSRVNFQRVGATTQWVVRKEGATTAFWGDVCDEIKEMIDHGFETIEQGMFKLSGFLVVCKAMFELGPEWLDRYIREFLAEVISAELEAVIIKGTGKKQPIGMIKDLKLPIVEGAHADKEKVKLVAFTPQVIGEKILAPTTKKGTRPYTGVTLIINPLDYATKLFAYGAKQRDDGSWSYDNFAVPGLEIIQTPSMPLNTMVSGKPKDYFMGVAGEPRFQVSDEARLIEDQRLYLTRQLANGRPLDNDSFIVFDITDMAVNSGNTNTPDTP